MGTRAESSTLTEKARDTGEQPIPYRGPGLAARAGPFAAVAVVAEASLALPPGPTSTWPTAVSAVLLLATGLEFLLPWTRLPHWLAVLIPLTYTGSVLALMLAAGPNSGVGIVILIPLIWTALFGAQLESGCVVAAIVAVELIVSLTPVTAPGAVIARRILLWTALGVLISVATHGLRDRIRHAQQRALLQDELRALTVMEDRDRIAADLGDGVIQRIFAAGLTLQGAMGMTANQEVRDRVESAAGELDQAARLLRDTIFGLDRRLPGRGFRAELLSLCDGLSPAPEVGFTGPVDGALDPASQAQLVELLRDGLALIGAHAEFTRVDITTGAESFSTVAEVRLLQRAAEAGESGPELAGLRSTAEQAGVHIEIQETPGGIRFAWHLPLDRPLSPAVR